MKPLSPFGSMSHPQHSPLWAPNVPKAPKEKEYKVYEVEIEVTKCGYVLASSESEARGFKYEILSTEDGDECVDAREVDPSTLDQGMLLYHNGAEELGIDARKDLKVSTLLELLQELKRKEEEKGPRPLPGQLGLWGGEVPR